MWVDARLLRSNFAEIRDDLYDSVPPNHPMSLITPTVVVGVAGLLALAIVVAPPPFLTHRREAFVGIALSAVCATTLTLFQVAPVFGRKTDPNYLSATTGATSDTPAIPNMLGQQRFALSLPPSTGTPFIPQAVGSRFVTPQALPEADSVPAVIAYDAAGHQRWHYSRTGPMPITDLRVYQSGKVVIADASTRQARFLIGLAAVTGTPLWSSTDRDVRSVFHDNQRTDSYSWRSESRISSTADSRTGLPTPAHRPSGVGSCEPVALHGRAQTRLFTFRRRSQPPRRWGYRPRQHRIHRLPRTVSLLSWIVPPPTGSTCVRSRSTPKPVRCRMIVQSRY